MALSPRSFDDLAGAPSASGRQPPDRSALRKQLIERRLAFAAGAEFASARLALAGHLRGVLQTLDPACLGVYAAMRGEFNPAGLCRAGVPAFALPYATRAPPTLHFRAWDCRPPTLRDDCGLPTADGAPVVPDVVLVPCVGYTRSGWRLGYGGGYFDRWLGAHAHVTAVGVAWSVGEIDAADFAAAAHDRALTLIVTEHGVVA